MSGAYTLAPSEYTAPSLDTPDLPSEEQPQISDTSAPAAPARGARPDLKKLVAFTADHFGVDQHVLAGMVMKESMLNDDVVSGKRKSSAGAVGIAQFMPDTAKRYGIDPTDPTQSVIAMGAYLRDNLAKFDGDYERAIAGYNWGENRGALKAGDWRRSAPAETTDYVDFVTQFARQAAASDPRKPLPDGVAPSAAGAGRGSVSPGDANTHPGAAEPEQGHLSTMRDSLARGVPGLMQGLSGTALRANAGIVGNIAEVERKLAAGKKPSTFTGDEDPYGLVWMTPQQRVQFREQTLRAAGGNAASIAAAEATKAEYPAPPVVSEVLKAKTWGDALSAFARDPLRFIESVGPESLVQSAPGLVAGALLPGSAAMKAAAMGVGSGATDYGSSIIDGLQNAGVDTRDPIAVQEAAKNPELLRKIASEAMAHAGPVGAVDALSGGVASKLALPAKVLAKNLVARELANVAVQTPVQGVFGGAGEALGELAAGQELQPGNILAEVVGESFGAPAEVAGIGGAAAMGRIQAAHTAAPGFTNFTEPNSPSAKAGLTPIVVPDMPAVATSGTDAVEVGNPPQSLSAERHLANRLAERFGIEPDAHQQATPDDIAPDGESTPPGGATRREPATLMMGRSGSGYATAMDATVALQVGRKREPDLTWSVEPIEGGRFRVAGYSAGDARTEPNDGSAPTGDAGEWQAFPPGSGTLGIPRAEMPQIKAEHRGAMVNFLNARGIAHEQVEVPARSLKATQAEFSPAKVEQAAAYTGGDRSILISSDGYVLDGHHQWIPAVANDRPVKAIRLDAPITKLMDEVRQFPSATLSDGAATGDQHGAKPAEPGAAVAVAPSAAAGVGAVDGVRPAAGGPEFAGGTAADRGAEPAQLDGGVADDPHLREPAALAADAPARGPGPRAVARLTPEETRQVLKSIQDVRLKRNGEPITLTEVPAGKSVDTDAAQGLADVFGKPVIFAKLTKPKGGAGFSAVNTAKAFVVTSDAKDAHVALTMHEVVHAMPDDVKKTLLDALRPHMKVAQHKVDFPDYRAEIREEEIAASLAQQHVKTPEFWAELRGKMGDGPFAKLAEHILSKLKEIVGRFTHFKLTRYASDVNAVRDALTTAYAETARRRNGGTEFNRERAPAGPEERTGARAGQARDIAAGEAQAPHRDRTPGAVASEADQADRPDLTIGGTADKNEKDAPYETDLIGDPLPTSARAGRDRSQRAASNRDVDGTAGVPPGSYASSTAIVTTRSQQLGHSGPVRSPADAANALAYLNRSAVERLDALVTNSAGQPLAVVGGFKGALTQASVYPATLVGEAIRVPNAANLWLVHNHPSGAATLSSADRNLQGQVARAFAGTAISVRDIIAVTDRSFESGNHREPLAASGDLEPLKYGPKVPVQEREITSPGKLAAVISGPADALRASAELAAVHGNEPGLMLLDARHQPIAYVPWASADMLPLKGNGKLDALFRAVSYSNAGAALIVDPRGDYTLKQINNLAGALMAVDVRPLDAIQSGRSLAELGILLPDEIFLSRAPKAAPAGEEAAALQALSENDALFALPKSDQATVAGIVADNDPTISVRQTQVPGRTDYTLTLPSGKTARVMVREANPYGGNTYGFNYADGELSDVLDQRPGENPEDVDPEKGDVWIDVSLLDSGDEGRMVYNIAATYAHNTGRVFIGDPAGLSNEAMRRRSEQMLSSALKFGTTEHLAPHPRQTTGDAALGVPPLRWVYGDHLGNIRRLIDVNLKALENAGGEGISFDTERGEFLDSDGHPLDRAGIAELAQAGLGRSALAGGSTLARGSVLRALLREEGAGVEGAHGRRDGLLARLVRQSSVHPQATGRVFYSRDEVEPASPAGLTSSAELAASLKAAFPQLGKAFDRMLVRGERGAKGGLVAVESGAARDMAAALASKTGRTVEHSLATLEADTTQTFRATNGDTQGFYDSRSGLTFVVLPNVTAQTAPGVVLHEVAHSQQRVELDRQALALIDDRATKLHPAATRAFLGRVAQRMVDAGEAGSSHEAASYLVEQAVIEGRQEGFSAADGKFMGWVEARFGKRVGGLIRDFVAMVRAWGMRHGVELSPTIDDLVAYAKAGVLAAARGDVVSQNGGDVHSSSRADQTLTPAFRKWFGNSKVVDDEGKPLVMYRGDSSDIGPIVDPARGRLGLIFFSPSPAFAAGFAKAEGAAMTPAFVRAERPFDSSVKAQRDAVFAKLGSTDISDAAMTGGGWEVLEDPDVVRAVKAAGFDAMYVREEGEDADDASETRNIAVFSASQAKSAIGNNGAFDGANPDIRFSVRAGARPPSETMTRKIQRYGQDMMNRFTVIKNWAESEGVNLSDDADVWSFEERMHGRVASRVQDFRELTVKPLVKQVQKAGFTMGQIGEYLHMQHAEERNRQVAKLYPEFTDGSGVTTGEARRYLDQADPQLAALANKFQAITEDTLRVLSDAGIINTDMTRAFAGAYRHYVPLKGATETPPSGEPSQRGKGNSVNGDIERALGRGRGVDPQIVPNILRDHERAIFQAEKNTLGHSLLAFATEIANPEIATIGDPEKRRFVKLGYQFEVTDDAAAHPTVYRTFDDESEAYKWVGQQDNRADLRVRKTIANQQVDAEAGKLADNEVRVYVAGHAIKVQLNDPGLSRAYQRLGTEQLPVYLAMAREINKALSKAYTGWNPEFAITNTMRDFTHGLANITGHFGAGAATKVVAQYPKALAALMRYAYTGKSTPAIDAYRAAGGSTGAAYLSDIERVGKDIERSYNDYVGALALAQDGKTTAAAGAATRKLIRGLTGWIEGLNQATENAFRLATFEALRKEHGINKAASAAKNSTVNFNRRGELGAAMGAMYLFFNPTVQGTASLASALTQGEHKAQARAVVAGLVALTYTLAALQYGDDDDDEFKRIPGYVKDRSIIIRLSGGRYITIPIPYGYGFAATAGTALYDTLNGKNADEVSMSLASSVLDNFSPVGNPLGGANKWGDADARGMLELVPGMPFGDLTRDAVRVLANRSGLGHPIMPESPFDEGKPDAMKVNRSTKGTVFDKAAKGLSAMTGGTATQAGGLDVSPETLKFWTRAITGGAGTFVADSARLAELEARKLAGEPGELSPELKEIPILRRVARDSDIGDIRSMYWTAAREAKEAAQNFARARKAHDSEGMDKVQNEREVQLQAERMFVRTNKAVGRLRNAIDAVNADDSLSLGMKRIQVKEIEAEERSLYEDAVRAYGQDVRASSAAQHAARAPR